jgi:hypothetical protein
MTSELASRMLDPTGEMHRAIVLAESLLSQTDSNLIKSRQKEKILQNRKRRKIASDHQSRELEETRRIVLASQHQPGATAKFTSRSPYMLPTSLASAPKLEEEEPDQRVMVAFMKAWKRDLSAVDVVASSRVTTRLQDWSREEGKSRCLLQMGIEQVGFAWLWVHFVRNPSTGWHAQIHRVNVVAESEIEGVSGCLFYSAAELDSY